MGFRIDEHLGLAPHVDDPVFDVSIGIGQAGSVVVTKTLQGHGSRSQNPEIGGTAAAACSDSRVVVQPELRAAGRRFGFQHAVGNLPVRVADEDVGTHECRHVVRSGETVTVSVSRSTRRSWHGTPTVQRDAETGLGQLRSAISEIVTGRLLAPSRTQSPAKRNDPSAVRETLVSADASSVSVRSANCTRSRLQQIPAHPVRRGPAAARCGSPVR